jgi:hypothetical protein
LRSRGFLAEYYREPDLRSRFSTAKCLPENADFVGVSRSIRMKEPSILRILERSSIPGSVSEIYTRR